MSITDELKRGLQAYGEAFDARDDSWESVGRRIRVRQSRQRVMPATLAGSVALAAVVVVVLVFGGSDELSVEVGPADQPAEVTRMPAVREQRFYDAGLADPIRLLAEGTLEGKEWSIVVFRDNGLCFGHVDEVFGGGGHCVPEYEAVFGDPPLVLTTQFAADQVDDPVEDEILRTAVAGIAPPSTRHITVTSSSGQSASASTRWSDAFTTPNRVPLQFFATIMPLSLDDTITAEAFDANGELIGRSRSLPERDQGCSGSRSVRADLDGDGVADAVIHDGAGGRGLRVCLGAGSVLEVEGLGTGEGLEVIDVEPDGRPEIVYGATTAYNAGSRLAVVEEGDLHVIVASSGLPLEMSSGPSSPENFETGPFAAWGCADVTGDEQRELIQLSASRATNDTIEWSWRAYRITGATARQVAEDSGSEQSEKRLSTFTRQLAPTCPGITT